MALLRFWRINRFYLLNIFCAILVFGVISNNLSLSGIYYGKINTSSPFFVIFSAGFIFLDHLYMMDVINQYLIKKNEIKIRKRNINNLILKKISIVIVLLVIRMLVLCVWFDNRIEIKGVLDVLMTVLINMAVNVNVARSTVDRRLGGAVLINIIIRLI